MNRILSLFLCLGLGTTALAQNLKEGPWFNYNVNGINRLPARATSYSYDDQAKALAGDREASRMVSLNGTWKFTVTAQQAGLRIRIFGDFQVSSVMCICTLFPKFTSVI